MNKISCKVCRRAMRLWALDSRRETNHRELCIRVAISFRDGPCFCTPEIPLPALVSERGIWKEAA